MQLRRVWGSYWGRAAGGALGLFLLIPLVARRYGGDYLTGVYIGTGIAVLWYTVEAYYLRREMMASRQRLETPEVSVRFEKVTTGFFDIVVENISDVPALNVSFDGVPALPLTLNKTTAEIGFLRHGVKYLPPRQAYRSLFLMYPRLDANTQHSTVEFVYTFENREGLSFTRRVEINLSLFYDMTELAADFQSRLLQQFDTLNTTLQVLRDTLSQHPDQE